MKKLKMTTVIAVILALAMSLCLLSCGSSTSDSQDNGESTHTEGTADTGGAIEGWPSDNSIAANIPVCTVGKISNVTEESKSVFAMVGDVTRDYAISYWDEAQENGYTNITSQSDTSSTGGFTYVASNDQNISLSVTWAPGIGEGSFTVLAIQL